MTRLFDFLFWPFRGADPLWAVAVFSIVTGVLMVLAFKYASNQNAIRRAKDRLSAHVMEVRLFQDQLGVVVGAYGRILRAMGVYMGYSLKPVAVLLLPLVVLLLQMDLRLGTRPAEPGAPLLVKAHFTQQDFLEQATLQLPEGLRQTAPALRIYEQREVDWRIQPVRSGRFELAIAAGGRNYEKSVVVSESLDAAAAGRFRSRLDSWLYPGEPALPGDGAVESIELTYPPREIAVAGWKMHWLIPFLVFSLAAGYAVKGVFRAEF